MMIFFFFIPTGLVMTTSRKLDREQQDEHILEVSHGQLSFMLLKETVLRGWFSLPNCRGHYRCKALCFWRFIGLFFPEEYISFCCVKLSFGAKLTHHWHGYSISCRWKKFSFFKTFFHFKPKWQIRFPVPFRQLPVKRFFVDILMMDMAVWNCLHWVDLKTIWWGCYQTNMADSLFVLFYSVGPWDFLWVSSW